MFFFIIFPTDKHHCHNKEKREAGEFDSVNEGKCPIFTSISFEYDIPFFLI